jgi:hypothetical protein
MKELASSFAVAVGAVCFGLFVTVFKPDSIRAVPEPSRPAYCKVAVRTAHDCRPHALAAISGLVAADQTT